MEWITMELLRRKLPMDIPIPEFDSHTEDFVIKMKWISVTEKTPKMGEWVLSYAPEHDITAVTQYRYFGLGTYYWKMLSSVYACCDGRLAGVTHWMTLPRPPIS